MKKKKHFVGQTWIKMFSFEFKHTFYHKKSYFYYKMRVYFVGPIWVWVSNKAIVPYAAVSHCSIVIRVFNIVHVTF